MRVSEEVLSKCGAAFLKSGTVLRNPEQHCRIPDSIVEVQDQYCQNLDQYCQNQNGNSIGVLSQCASNRSHTASRVRYQYLYHYHHHTVQLKFTKKVTTRREWFEDLARNIANPMGIALALNRTPGHFGRKGHKGVALMGTSTAGVG